MGLLSRLFGRQQTVGGNPALARGSVEASLYDGNETLEVVGESHYQEELWRIVGGRRTQGIRHGIVALLVPDPENQHDPDAVQIRIEGSLVGFLSREDAEEYRPGLLRLMDRSTNRLVALQGVVVGGGERTDGRGLLGVFLDHNPEDFGIESRRSKTSGFRTGFSEAMATDLADDSYDFSWFLELSSNDEAAIKELRCQLETDPDPIDRHYVMCELEGRLYRSRDAFPSALGEFDAVCRQHDEEMVSIRPALFTKFGKVPFLEVYKQAAIRCQKSKDWQAMRHWTERGISVYGEHAAQPEQVEDLHKRLAYAMAKLDSASTPRKRASSKALVVPAEPPVVETLVCATCGVAFDRVRTRGRKPRDCPTCRTAQ